MSADSVVQLPLDDPIEHPERRHRQPYSSPLARCCPRSLRYRERDEQKVPPLACGCAACAAACRLQGECGAWQAVRGCAPGGARGQRGDLEAATREPAGGDVGLPLAWGLLRLTWLGRRVGMASAVRGGRVLQRACCAGTCALNLLVCYLPGYVLKGSLLACFDVCPVHAGLTRCTAPQRLSW